MAVRSILEVQAKPGIGDELIAFFKLHLSTTRAHEGCMSVDALQNSDDADNLMVVEVWDSHEQQKKYLASHRERGTSDQLREFLAKPPSIRIFDVLDA